VPRDPIVAVVVAIVFGVFAELSTAYGSSMPSWAAVAGRWHSE
jgi:hypothetical protein